MIAGGASKAADALLAKLPDEPLLAFARAARLEQKGEVAPALTLFDALANGRDRLASARAGTRATLLRLPSGAVPPAQAADQLMRNVSSWRGDVRERDLRLQTADVQAQAGQWRDSLGTLREAAQAFPRGFTGNQCAYRFRFQSDAERAECRETISPLDLVTLVEENADAIAKSGITDLTPLLVDKLIALDLPDRAGPVIQRMINASPDAVSRATLGARLAALQLASAQVTAAGAATCDDRKLRLACVVG